jgi:predicted O-methyltransferase YrrM
VPWSFLAKWRPFRFRLTATIVEFGTSFGISTMHLAAALQDNGAD